MDTDKNRFFIYPLQEFSSLEDAAIRWDVVDKNISIAQAMTTASAPRNNSLELDDSLSLSAKILAELCHPQTLLGSPAFVFENNGPLLQKIEDSIAKDEPIYLFLMCCPCKIPNPIKTSRVRIDLGEILFFHQMIEICQRIEQVYKPGARVTIVAEGILAEYLGVPKKRIQEYSASLKSVLLEPPFSTYLSFHDLYEIKDHISDFDSRLEILKTEFLEACARKDENILREVESTFPVIYRSVDTHDLDIDLLCEIYSSKKSSTLDRYRTNLAERAMDATAYYRSFLKLRDGSSYFETVLPNHLKLTYSAKPQEIGVVPLHKQNRLLPYHGVPVFWKSKNIFTVEYLIDLMQMDTTVDRMFLDADNDNSPYFYAVA